MQVHDVEARNMMRQRREPSTCAKYSLRTRGDGKYQTLTPSKFDTGLPSGTFELPVPSTFVVKTFTS
jgi:hypothetical protein